MTDLIGELNRLADEAVASIAQAASLDDLERLRVAYLGRKSRLQDALKRIPEFPAEQRGAIGRRVNALKAGLESQLAARRGALAETRRRPAPDVTLPGDPVASGRLHPVTITARRILAVFAAMGFEAATGPEMEFEYYNFDGLNIPPDHPSRESFDTFFVDLPSPDPKRGRLLLRSHTSPVQIRVMERRRPPLRIVVPGKVYRRDALDPGHSFMFHQVEGLMVDDRTNFADLKGVLDRFLKSLFGPGTKTRFRPHYFPFTEPSAEVDIASSLTAGAQTSFAKKRWIEIMGCGMVHPNVLRACGHDPARVQGFAFGMGVERIAMLMRGVKDIRLLFENDIRFLEQW
ncbi:MAG TPA: phenylalanine--tRNA ligase subunit alpha [bacterium]